MTAYSLPRDLEEAIVRLLYNQASELDWSHLSDAERTIHYQRWIDDPQIGGKLVLFMKKPEAVRVWMKDGPMKEYSRARYGVGKYAQFADGVQIGAQALIAKALGMGWHEIPGTLQIKPLRVTIRSEDHENERRFCWGPARDLKHLVWRAISEQADGDPSEWVICVVSPSTDPPTRSERAHRQRLAARLGLEIIEITQ